MNKRKFSIFNFQFLIESLTSKLNSKIINLKSAGVIVPSMVFIMVLLTISALALSDFAVRHFARVNDNYFASNALLTAEAGAEQSLYELNQNNTFTGFSSEQEIFSNNEQGRGTYQTEIIEGAISNEKLIISTGRVYRKATDSLPFSTRKIRLTVVGTTTDQFAVHTGPGGLIMTNTATIANGEVHVNGYLSMSNSARIGSAENTLRVFVAHVNCPEAGGASYPEQCVSGEPITITNTAHIYGEVRATNQSNGDSMSNPGLIAGSTADPVALPTHDRDAQIAAIGTTISGSAASCGASETRTYQANTKIEGDLILANNCKATILGNLWITGKFELKNSAQLRFDDSIVSIPDIMVDGTYVKILNNSSLIENSSDIAGRFITYRSAAACSPDCVEVTGMDLYNSRNIATIEIQNSTLAPGSVFYSRWTKVILNNSGSIGGVIGQTVELQNTGNISFGTQLSSGQNLWTIKNYQQIFD